MFLPSSRSTNTLYSQSSFTSLFVRGTVSYLRALQNRVTVWFTKSNSFQRILISSPNLELVPKRKTIIVWSL
ncbi:hypothetical protein BCAH1134_C0184 (plasmid) [Bacillus cereus AH1134]|nr:hypothetical protein BCAH1134_C0184 [Bacillus cereus AH1134]